MKILKLNTKVFDKVTETDGSLVMLNIDMNGNLLYLFQPYGLSPETKQPLDTFWVTANRIRLTEEVNIDIPVVVIGSQVEDKASGFNGIATGLFYHVNGCIHVEVKPKGTIEKTGQTIKPWEFDIRRLKGERIVEMSDGELEKSHKKNPSPINHPSIH